MWDRIESLIELAVGPVRAVATAARNAIAALYSLITSVMTNIGGKWSRLSNVVSFARDRIKRYAVEVYTSLRWLVTIQIPRVAASFTDQLRRWVLSALDTLGRQLRSAVDNVSRWATDLINRLRSTVDSLIRWAQREVGEIRNWLQWFTRTVLPRITSPALMADWLAGAMFGALLRYLAGHAEAFADWVLRNAVRSILRQLPRVERFITRVF